MITGVKVHHEDTRNERSPTEVRRRQDNRWLTPLPYPTHSLLTLWFARRMRHCFVLVTFLSWAATVLVCATPNERRETSSASSNPFEKLHPDIIALISERVDQASYPQWSLTNSAIRTVADRPDILLRNLRRTSPPGWITTSALMRHMPSSVIKELLEESPTRADQDQSLITAVLGRRLDIVRILLEKGGFYIVVVVGSTYFLRAYDRSQSATP